MKEELPAYLVAAAAVKDEKSWLLWWKGQTQLPAWQRAAKMTYAFLPSSAPAALVCSHLRVAANHLQHNLLVDHVEASQLLQYKCGRRSKTRHPAIAAKPLPTMLAVNSMSDSWKHSASVVTIFISSLHIQLWSRKYLDCRTPQTFEPYTGKSGSRIVQIEQDFEQKVIFSGAEWKAGFWKTLSLIRQSVCTDRGKTKYTIKISKKLNMTIWRF